MVAIVFCDFSSQSVDIGEFQHIGDSAVIKNITMIGEVLSKRKKAGKTKQISLFFDSSGIAVQDLFIGQHLIDVAIDANYPIEC